MATVRATNGTSGLVVFNKAYPIPSSTLRGQGSIRDAVFLLNVPVVPYSLSVNVDVNVKNGTGTSAFGVSRQIDINLRGHVDIVDAGVLAFAFDSTPLHGNWNPRADFDADGLVDITDAATIAFLFDAPDFI
jgi:hypothetical protein